MKLEDLFDDKGNLPGDFDPYRCRRSEDPRYDVLFDEDGNLKYGTSRALKMLVKKHVWGPWSDAVGMVHANRHAGSTKGSYPTIYFWR